METSFSAADNPELVKELLNKALEDAVVPEVAVPDTVIAPPDDHVQLLGGYYDSFSDDLIMTAQVRELNGEDEEVISRAGDPGRALMQILSRGVVKIGEKQASAEILDGLLAGDREWLLLNIRRVTLGNDIPFQGPCPHCNVEGEFSVDLSKIKADRLANPVADRTFTVDCKAGPVSVSLPTGETQKKLVELKDKTGPELDSVVLRECIDEINGLPVTDKNAVKRLGILDRREILKQITERNPGPLLHEASAPCTACGQEVPIPLTLADIFRL